MTSLKTNVARELGVRVKHVMGCEPPRAGLRKAWRLIASVGLGLAMFAMPCTAQSHPPSQLSEGVQIELLGTAGGPPLRKDRSEPSSLLIVDGRPYLIDCGIGTMRRMVRAGIRSETIGTIFLTHLHPDHDLDLANVMANDFQRRDLAGAVRTINIYGPPETQEFVKAAFSYISIPYGVFAAEQIGGTAIADPFKAHEIQQAGLVYHDDKIRVFAAENSHYALMPAKFRARMKSYSYRFETPYGVIVFTGDTGPSDAVAQFAKGADVLVSEASRSGKPEELAAFVHAAAQRNHWSPERSEIFMAHMTREHLDLKEVGELATKAQVSSVILYHHDPKDPAASVAGVKKYFSGTVFAGADLDRYCLGGPTGKETGGARVLHRCK